MGSGYTDEMYAAGMKAHVNLPVDDVQLRLLSTKVPEVVAQALAERRSDAFVPLAPRDMMATTGNVWKSRTVAVWSPKGGAGKTFTAVNLAAALGVVGMRKTLLVDADVSRANVHVYLGLSTDRNLFALINQASGRRNGGQPTLSPALLKQNITHYGAQTNSKLDVLVGIPKMQMAGTEELRDDELVRAVLTQAMDIAEREYDFRIMDLGPDLNMAMHDAAIRKADLVLLVATPELTCINDLRNVLPALRGAYLSLDRFELVINKYADRYGIAQQDLLRELGMKKFGFIPADEETAVLSINHQCPVVLESKPGELADGIMSIASQLYGDLDPIWQRRGGRIAARYKRPAERKSGEGIGKLIKNLLIAEG
jgi:pilus assembly protein CpaE